MPLRGSQKRGYLPSHCTGAQWHAGVDFACCRYETYCPTCPNGRLLLAWGLYLEDNANKQEAEGTNCTSPLLKEAAKNALDDFSATARGELTAPPCKKNLTDVEGQEYLDFTAGIGVTNLGHCHPRITAAVQEQVGKLVHGQGTC